jgi:outer membrane lipoprotein-sorting protein
MGATMKKYKRSIFIVVLMLVLSTSVFAGDIKSDRETLKNLKGVHVHVQDLNQDIEQAGLSKDQIRTDVELKLRLAGIKVLTLVEHYEGKGAPYLHIYIDYHKT